MKYKVHHFDINLERNSRSLEKFLNGLAGEIVAVIPNVKKTSLGQIYGFSRKIDFLVIIEKVG